MKTIFLLFILSSFCYSAGIKISDQETISKGLPADIDPGEFTDPANPQGVLASYGTCLYCNTKQQSGTFGASSYLLAIQTPFSTINSEPASKFSFILGGVSTNTPKFSQVLPDSVLSKQELSESAVLQIQSMIGIKFQLHGDRRPFLDPEDDSYKSISDSLDNIFVRYQNSIKDVNASKSKLDSIKQLTTDYFANKKKRLSLSVEANMYFPSDVATNRQINLIDLSITEAKGWGKRNDLALSQHILVPFSKDCSHLGAILNVTNYYTLSNSTPYMSIAGSFTYGYYEFEKTTRSEISFTPAVHKFTTGLSFTGIPITFVKSAKFGVEWQKSINKYRPQDSDNDVKVLLTDDIPLKF